jgi:hypothetical protein
MFHTVALLMLTSAFIGGALLVIAIEERNQLREELRRLR